MNSADGTIHFNLSFSQNSVYLHVRSRERFVNPQLLKQLTVYKIKERFNEKKLGKFLYYYRIILVNRFTNSNIHVE